MVSPRPSRWLARASQWAATVQVDWMAADTIDHWLEECLRHGSWPGGFHLFAIAGGENNCTTAVLHECDPFPCFIIILS